MEWKNLERFPASNMSWGVLKGKKLIYGEKYARAFANRWRPFDTSLISTPNSIRFLPAICIQDFASSVFSRYKKQYSTLIQVSAVYLILVISYGLFSILPNSNEYPVEKIHIYYKWLTIFSLIFLYMVFNQLISVNSYQRLSERTLFYHWLLSRKHYSIWLLPGTVCIIGVFQAYYLTYQGTLDSLISNFGILYSEELRVQFWRYILGPFFHSSLTHFITNLVMLMIVLFIIWPFTNNRIILTFFCTLIFSTFISQLFAPAEIDGFLGVSGGVFGLFGWATSDSIRRIHIYPKLFWATIATFSSFNFFIPLLLNPSSSFSSHISGYLLGFFIGISGFAKPSRNEGHLNESNLSKKIPLPELHTIVSQNAVRCRDMEVEVGKGPLI